jgi:hypothetical protein
VGGRDDGEGWTILELNVERVNVNGLNVAKLSPDRRNVGKYLTSYDLTFQD